jgi:hypothetical protein
MRKADSDDVKYSVFQYEVKKHKPSKHPLVKFMKKIEDEDEDTRTAMIAGFQAEHCRTDFKSGREIAKVRLPNGKVRRAYACDVCGQVHFRETHS